MRAERPLAGMLGLSLLLFLFAAANFVYEGPRRGTLLFIAALMPFVLVRLRVVALQGRVDSRLKELLADGFHGFRVVLDTFPDYRFVDVFRAIEKSLEGPLTETLDSTHLEDLGTILRGKFDHGLGFVREPPRASRATEPSGEAYFPAERFSVRKRGNSNRAGVIARLHVAEYTGSCWRWRPAMWPRPSGS